MLALRLEPSAATDTLVGQSSDAYRATERYRQRFGDDAIDRAGPGRPAPTSC